jgi:hypothetical protein
MALLTALSAMSSACQGIANVELPTGYRVPLSLYILIIALSGERKTAVENAFFLEIKKIERELLDKHQKDIEDYKRRIHNWSLHERELGKLLARAASKCEETKSIEARQIDLYDRKPISPPTPRFIYKDITPNALAHSLYKNISLACLVSSESGDLFNGKAMQELGIYNEIWSGSSVTVDRKSSDDFSITNPRLTLALMIQPDILYRFLKKRGSEAIEGGFLSRFLVINPNSYIGLRVGENSPPNKEIINNFHGRMRQMMQQSIDIEINNRNQKLLQFTPNAKEKWRNIAMSIEKNMEQHGFYHHANGHGSKLMDNISRLAGIIHTFEGLEGDISSHTLEYAYSLCIRCSEHYMKFIAGTPEIVTLTNQLVIDIRKIVVPSASTYRFCDSKIQQRCHNSLREKQKRFSAYQLLEQLGHLKKIDAVNFEFKETILTRTDPQLKNGKHYNVSELPLFSEQRIDPNYPAYGFHLINNGHS